MNANHDTTETGIRSVLEPHLNKQLLRYAVMRQIQCQSCRDILDVRRSVLLTTENDGAACICAACFDRTREHVLKLHPTAEILDGRSLYKRPRAPRKAAPDAISISVAIRPTPGGRARSRRVTAHAVNGAPFYVHRTIGDRTRWTISRACGSVADLALIQGIKGRDVAARIARRFWDSLDDNQRHEIVAHSVGAPLSDTLRVCGAVLRRVRREVETPAAAHA